MRRIAIVSALALISAAACGGSDSGGAIEPGGTTPGATTPTAVTVALDEWSVTVSPTSAAAGSVAFEVENTGTMAHEFVVIETDLAADALPVEDGVVPEDAEGIEVVGEIEEFPAGETKSATMAMSAGAYVLICNVSGHYQTGMRTAFNVT